MATQAILALCCQDLFAVNFKIASLIQFADFKKPETQWFSISSRKQRVSGVMGCREVKKGIGRWPLRWAVIFDARVDLIKICPQILWGFQSK